MQDVFLFICPGVYVFISIQSYSFIVSRGVGEECFAWKISQINAFHNSGERDDIRYYEPFLKNPCYKLFESLVSNKICPQINKLLYDSQYEFRDFINLVLLCDHVIINFETDYRLMPIIQSLQKLLIKLIIQFNQYFC